MTALWPDGLRRTENTKTRTQIHPHHVHLYTFKKYQWVHETNSIRILILTKATAFLCKSKLMNAGTYKSGRTGGCHVSEECPSSVTAAGCGKSDVMPQWGAD